MYRIYYCFVPYDVLFQVFPYHLNVNATELLLLHTPWVWGLPVGKWIGFGSAQVSCYPWGCGYTVKDSPRGKIIGFN